MPAVPIDVYDRAIAERNALRAEIERLRWLIEWVDENASFSANEWPEWEKRRDHPQPWLLDD